MAAHRESAEAQPAHGMQRLGHEAIATKIVELIAASRLKPGDRLPTERALGERLGVSRTLVREAIKTLAANGLVRSRQGSGIYVASEPRPFAMAAINLSMPVDPEHMLSLFEFRCTLEMETARLAAQRITPRELHALGEVLAQHRRMAESGQLELISRQQMSAETPNPDRAFHVGIAEASHNEFFVATIASAIRLQSRAIELVLAGAPGSFLIAADQHDAVYEAIRLGHEEEAALAMRTHIQTVRAAYQQEVRRLLAAGLPAPHEHDGSPALVRMSTIGER